MLGVLAAALFYGDAMLTPAISVLSAVEGLTIVEAKLEPLVLPISVLILIGLFSIQARGTARVGALFGPIVLVYFAALAVLGIANIIANPEILSIFNPAGRSVLSQKVYIHILGSGYQTDKLLPATAKLAMEPRQIYISYATLQANSTAVLVCSADGPEANLNTGNDCKRRCFIIRC